MSEIRRCSKPGCSEPAVATFSYDYDNSTAVVGPLLPNQDPGSWDLCAKHSARITVPVGWELTRVEDIVIDRDEDSIFGDDDDLTALAKAVDAAGKNPSVASHFSHPSQQDFKPTVMRPRRHLSVVPDPEPTEEET